MHAHISETDPQRKTYAMMIADTVLVTPSGNEFLTKNDLDFKTVSYTLDESDEVEVVENRNTALATSRLRDRDAESLQKFSKEDKRREDQRKLAQKLAEQEQARLATLSAAAKGPSGKDPSEINTYASVDNFPSSITSSHTVRTSLSLSLSLAYPRSICIIRPAGLTAYANGDVPVDSHRHGPRGSATANLWRVGAVPH